MPAISQHIANPVVVTRPLAQAAAFAERVSALGRVAVLFPLLEILPLENPGPLCVALAELARYDLVAFVSPNAIDAAFAELPDWPCAVPLAIIGEGSRAALARHGVTSANATIFSPRDPNRTDSETLLAALDLNALRGRKVLILRGQTGRELLADALRSAGADVVQVAAYRRVAPELDATGQAMLRHLAGSSNDWVITSSEALHILVNLVERFAGHSAVSDLQRQHLLVPHLRINETAQALGFGNVTLTAAGDEHLLAALQFQR
jgi:uroporphyrinogen-III synthase